MANLLSTLFASNQKYLAAHISQMNSMQAFPVRKLVSNEDFIRELQNDSVLISGGTDEERSLLLMGLIRCTQGCIVVLHNGNRFLTTENMRRHGMNAKNWDDNIYTGLSKAEILSLLTGSEKDPDLTFFYAFAFDVCETLGRPVTIESLNAIDWLGTDWQQELIAGTYQCDRILDLISRYDRSMAERAAKGVCRLERLARNMKSGQKDEGSSFTDGNIVVKEVYGSKSAICKQCLEIIRLNAEKGQKFTLVLDDVYDEEDAVIRDNYRNVKLVLSAADITQLSEGMYITGRPCSLVAFNHSSFRSADIISKTFFGDYERLYCDVTSGYNKSFLEPRTYQSSLNIRQGRDARLKPEMITSIPMWCAFIRIRNGMEGYINLMKRG